MDFRLSEEQEIVRGLIKRFGREINKEELVLTLRQQAKAQTVEELKASFPYKILEKLHDLGLRQLAIPQEFGGTSPIHQVNVTLTMAAEELGYWAGPVVGLVIIPWIFLRTIAVNKYVNREQKHWIFKKFLDDPHFIIATAVSEPESASDIHLPYDEGGKNILKTKAVKKANGWIVDGVKSYCSAGGVANYIMVATRTEEEAPVSEACTFFWIPSDAKGVHLKPHNMLVTDFGGNCEVVLNDVFVPDENMLGIRGRGFSIIKSFFNSHLPGIAGILGFIRKTYEFLRDYAKQRIAGGKPLIQHSATASKLGEMITDITACRMLIYRAAWEIDQAQERGLPDENLFWFASAYGYFKKISLKFCNLATTILGGMSTSFDLPLADLLTHVYYIQAAGLTREIDYMIANRDYDKLQCWGY
ncbi:MAG: acyl-CoA dehydrogenase family protein [candidate division WOR-3 bacterium]